jgi:hypothetical protein
MWCQQAFGPQPVFEGGCEPLAVTCADYSRLYTVGITSNDGCLMTTTSAPTPTTFCPHYTDVIVLLCSLCFNISCQCWSCLNSTLHAEVCVWCDHSGDPSRDRDGGCVPSGTNCATYSHYYSSAMTACLVTTQSPLPPPTPVPPPTTCTLRDRGNVCVARIVGCSKMLAVLELSERHGDWRRIVRLVRPQH